MVGNIIVRQDDTQRVFLSEGLLDVEEILKTHYGYIYESIQNENFILKYNQCNLFKELIFDSKVVGFCTYDFSRQFITAALNNIYVLPEFRGKGIFKNEILKTLEEHNKPSIMEPTRLIVELLIRYGFARKIQDNIVASAIEFIIPGENVVTNRSYENEELSTHFYDLNICASIHVLDFNNAHIAYSAPLNYDIIHYDCIEKRKSIDENYFLEIRDFFQSNDVELMNILVDLEESLPIKNYTLEEVIGPEDSFSQYIQSLIDDGHVTYQKAIAIKKQIKEEYEAGMILNESLLIRLAYLFDENVNPTIKSHDDVCPYCSMPIDDHDRFCHFCGINLGYDLDETQNNLMESLNTSDSDFKEDIRFVSYKFLKLIDEKIPLDYAIFTIENNYSITWDELDSFLRKNSYLIDGNLTDEGRLFLENHPLYYWEKYDMGIVNYSDFEDYFWANSHLDGIEICLNFLNEYGDDEYVSDIIDDIKKDV